jgi:hypothetical protein
MVGCLSVRPSVRMFQLKNHWSDIDEFVSELCAISWLGVYLCTKLLSVRCPVYLVSGSHTVLRQAAGTAEHHKQVFVARFHTTG